MKTILVTGSNGLLGQKLTDLILAENHFRLVATGRSADRYPNGGEYQYAQMDMLNAESVRETITNFQPDVIIHTAAMTNADQCEQDPVAAGIANVRTVETLVSICAEFNIQFIFLSTDFVFDGKNGPYTELDAPGPLNVYGHNKLEAEEIIKNSTAKWVIIRTILVYGVIADGSRATIVSWAKNALEKGEVIRVVNDQWRMPTLAEDLASACLLAIKKDAHGVFHISGNEYLSISQLVRKIADFWKLDGSLIQEISASSLSQPAARPESTGFILDKAQNELGYSPHTLEEGFALLEQQMLNIKN
ncbi:SDR family oxidoreductase [Pedobacter antarcticus]|uniref:SDR family oxidoreductase n=1 Tax=Pedobacter antarcticus TaxID=34086 RepID=UPI00292D34A6|nr:SDR family oxidoreductase [Pedobacter antarcticus]